MQINKQKIARLLAMENLNVEHRKVGTAYFDLNTRTLVLPTFQSDMTEAVYDLLVGHEVGHALDTPPAGWHTAISDRGPGYKSFLNVLEDVRIEKKIKARYPGIKKSFFLGYKELNEKNFFGIDGLNVNTLILIDRINLFYKIGAFIGVRFTDEEKEFLKRIDQMVTWEDVVRVADDLYDYCKDELLNRENSDSKTFEFDLNGMEFDAESSFDYDPIENDEFNTNGDDEDTEDPESEEANDLAAGTNDGANSVEENPQGQEFFGEEAEYDKLTAITDDHFREVESSLIDTKCLPTEYFEFPSIKNPQQWVAPYKKMLQYINPYPAGRPVSYQSFLSKNQKYINYLVKEFELRRNAQQIMRSKVSKTGELDMTKIWSYKFNEDIFKSITTVPNGKNHGLVMILDWSGSMRPNLAGTIEQAMVLVHFCKKVNIPFRVYAFVSGANPHKSTKHAKNLNKQELFITNNFFLAELFSDKMNRADFIKMCGLLIDAGNAAKVQGYIGLPMGHTPLLETISLLRWMIPEFRKAYGLEVVNTIILTDGDGGPVRSFGGDMPGEKKYNYVIVDRTTKKEFFVPYAEVIKRSLYKMQFVAMMDILRETTGSKLIGFYLMDRPSSDLRKFSSNKEWSFDNGVYEGLRAQLKSEKFAVVNQHGFDEYYLLRGGNSLEVSEEELQVDEGSSKSKILAAFRKNQSKKAYNRILLNRFINLIA